MKHAEIVDKRKNLLTEAARICVENGFVLASTDGYARGNPEDVRELTGFGLLIDDIAEQADSTAQAMARGTTLRKFAGVIWRENDEPRASSKKWAFQVYGKEGFEKAQDLADKLIAKLDVDITIYYMQDEDIFEKTST